MTHPFHRTSLSLAVGLLVTIGAGGHTAQAAGPCGSLAFDDGRVKTSRALAAKLPVPAADLACMEAIGAELAAQSIVRSVQLAVRVPDGQRFDGEALKVADALAQAMARGGIEARKISTVAPRVGHGQSSGVSITYRSKGRLRAVATVRDAWGDVTLGPSASSLRPARVGASLPDRSLVRTGALGVAVLALADGSAVRLGAGTTVRVGPIRSSADGERDVKLELRSGELTTHVTRRGRDSRFDIITRSAVAGVRGTSLRVSADERDRTRLETLTGLVSLGASGASVDVAARQGSRAEVGKPPEPPRQLLEGPGILAPLFGAATESTRLRWHPDGAARSYRVELARDADFVAEYRLYEVPRGELPLDGAQLTAGKWFWRVTSVDGDGFVGLPSRVHAFTTGG